MNVPAWLAEFYRQWLKARGLKLEPSTQSYSRPWEKLLDEAGLMTAADRSNAEAEARELEKKGHFALRFHKYRTYLIETIGLPLSEEPWLIALFGGTSAQDLRTRAVDIVASAKAEAHGRWPESWQHLCDRLFEAFGSGRNLAPFYWSKPDEVKKLLWILRALTNRDWEGSLIRAVSEELGLESKALEKLRSPLETALGLLFGEETSLESLGILSPESRATLQGSLCLHFEDGTTQQFDRLQGEITISLSDLLRASHASTAARRILSIENSKTTFRQAVAVNAGGDTLLIATSYPNAATRRLLEILPADLPHFHFGDTDPSGYAILRSLREIGCRNIEKFLMDWQDAESSRLLGEHDRRLLPSLIDSPLMSDCRDSLLALQFANRKGRFEQEFHGAPKLRQWPFWESAGIPRASVS